MARKLPPNCYAGNRLWHRGQPTRLDRRSGKTVIGYKKCLLINTTKGRAYGWALVTLRIPARTLRVQPTNYKCRATEAVVVSIVRLTQERGARKASLLDYSHHYKVPGKRKFKQARSAYDHGFRYIVGETVRPKGQFDPHPYNQCASGIHFFLTQQEACEYCA